MAGLYDDVVGGEYKGTNPWVRPRRAMGSNVYGGSAGGAGYYGGSAGGGTATRNPWGGLPPAYQSKQLTANQGGQVGQEQAPNPWTPSQAWTASNPRKPAYDLNAAKRMAYLKGNVGGTGNAEYDYLNSLKGQTPGFQQPQTGVKPYAGSQIMTDPMTGQRRNMAYNEYAALDPQQNAATMGNMQGLLQMLPQLQQSVMSVPSAPGEPSPQERWNTMLRRLLQGGSMGNVMNSNAWGGF